MNTVSPFYFSVWLLICSQIICITCRNYIFHFRTAPYIQMVNGLHLYRASLAPLQYPKVLYKGHSFIHLFIHSHIYSYTIGWLRPCKVLPGHSGAIKGNDTPGWSGTTCSSTSAEHSRPFELHCRVYLRCKIRCISTKNFFVTH